MPQHAKSQKLIPVVSDLESLSRCAARTLREMAKRHPSMLTEFTLADLRAAFENEFGELQEAAEELDLLIQEQGSDTKALLLDLEPAEIFQKIRAKSVTGQSRAGRPRRIHNASKTPPARPVQKQTMSEMITSVREFIREDQSLAGLATLGELYSALSTTFLKEQRKAVPDRTEIRQLHMKLELVAQLKQAIGSEFRLPDL